MKTKVIRLNTLEIREDLNYVKYCVDDIVNSPFVKRKIPLDIDVEKELSHLKEQSIKNSVNGRVISTKSRIVYDEINFCPVEEVTIKYE